jgi:hypothetical protein
MEHPKMLMSTWLSSLCHPTNLPELLKMGTVLHNIYCSPQDVQFLKDNYVPIANNAGLEVRFNYTIITSIGKHGRDQLHLAIKDQARYSINNKSIIIIGAADQIFGNGLGATVATLQKDEYMVCPVIRVSYEKGFESAKTFFNTPKSNMEIVKFFVEDIPHNLTTLALSGDHEYMRMKKLGDGYAFYHKEPPPLMCYGSETMFEGWSKGMMGQFEAIDHDIPDVYFNKGKLKWVDSSDIFVWGEFTSDKTYTSMITNSYHNKTTNFFKDNAMFLRTK